MSADTPRTDEQINGKPCTRFALLVGDPLRDALVPAEFARELERENVRLRQIIANAKTCADHILRRDVMETDSSDFVDMSDKMAQRICVSANAVLLPPSKA